MIAATPAFAGSLAEDATAFGTRESVQSMVLSPSGSKVAMLVSGPESETFLEIADLVTGKTKRITKSDGKPQSVRWCQFAGEEQLVCLHSGIQSFRGYLVRLNRLMTVDVFGKSLRPLGTQNYFEQAYLLQSDGQIIDWLPQDSGAVLMARNYVPEIGTSGSILGRTLRGLGVDRIELGTLRDSRVEPPRSGAAGYMTDGRGNVRLMSSNQVDRRTNQLTGKVRMRYRASGTKEWREFGTYDDVSREGFRPIAVDAESDSAYGLRKIDGRSALYRVKLDGSGSATLIAAEKDVDIDGVVRIGQGQRVIGFTYADERRWTIYFDREFENLQENLARAIPGQPLISFHGASADGQKLLVFASGDRNAGTFYRFDRASKALRPLAVSRPTLQGRVLAQVRPIRVTAPDGASIPAYLTIPPGSSGRNLPAVVFPHGGPSARDEWGFDWIAQFLAARGYAVIQPNFRGSSGYGDRWMAENGFRGWRTSIGDVTASARYLINEGIADPSRLAILGWSYGGYAALQSAAVEPSLYKAAVAIAPITDLGLLLKAVEGFSNEKIAKEFVGSGRQLIEGSPLQNSAAIRAPVLMIHGGNDANVAVAHSEQMLKALQERGKPVDLVTFKDLDHQLNDSSARVEMLNRIGRFLDYSLRR